MKWQSFSKILCSVWENKFLRKKECGGRWEIKPHWIHLPEEAQIQLQLREAEEQKGQDPPNIS